MRKPEFERLDFKTMRTRYILGQRTKGLVLKQTKLSTLVMNQGAMHFGLFQNKLCGSMCTKLPSLCFILEQLVARKFQSNQTEPLIML